MIGLIPVNYGDELLYEHLSLIVDEFEKAALRSGTRKGTLVTAQGPLGAMDMVLASSSKALSMNRTADATRAGPPANNPGSNSKGGAPASAHNSLDLVAGANPAAKGPSFEAGATGSIGFDADFNEILGGEGDPSKNGDTLGDWLSDCLGCDLRINFDWQLQPIDLLGPVASLLADINAALDKFDGFIDPFGYLKDLCNLLNGLNILCIPDLMVILASLKMLLKGYMTFQLNLKIDWTLLLGPLLKLILDGIVTLLQQIAGILVAPLDCAIGALLTISDLQDELQATAALAAAVANRIGDRTEAAAGAAGNILGIENDLDTNLEGNEFDISPRYKDVNVNSTELADGVSIPSISTSTRTQEVGGDTGLRNTANPAPDATFVQGFQITDRTTLPEALKNPQFSEANPFKKLAVTVTEAKNYIMSLVRKIVLALRSLEGLVSGSMSLSLGNLGLILFVKDMINLIILLISLLSEHKGVGDWCEFLEQNPEFIERRLRDASGVRAVASDRSINLVRGPEIVGEIKTCFNERSSTQSTLLNQWISDLKRDGSV